MQAEMKKCNCLPIPLTKILPKNSAAETRVQDHCHVPCMKGDRHPLSESKLEAHRGDPDGWSSLTLFLEIYSKDTPGTQAT